MENLTKQQIVLVTLLVSFVTSIATGIVTVSLMDQAPQGVTQTINRVVERTIERVVQAPSQQAAVVTKETVVVKEDDLVITATEENVKNFARIIYTTPDSSSVVALGILISKEGIIVVDSQNVFGADNYTARLSDGKTYPIRRIFDSRDSRLSLFKVVQLEGETLSFPFAKLADSDKIKLGQTLVYLGGKNENVVETGLISSLEYEKPVTSSDTATTSAETNTPRKVIDISLNIQPRSLLGGVVSNLSSEVIAFQAAGDVPRFIPSNQVSLLLNTYTTSLTSTSTASTKATNP